jgi:hypothetical protein
MRNVATINTKTFESRPAVRSRFLGTSIGESQYSIVISALWSITVGLQVLSMPQQVVFGSALAAASISGAIILAKPKAALVALPFFALLSPVAGFLDIFDARVLLSDLLFVFLGCQMVLLFYTSKNRFRSGYARLLGLVGVLYLVSSIIGLSVGTLVSWKPVVYVLQLVIVYFYTTALAGEEKDWALVINSWLVAAFLGSLLLIQAYMMGTPLADFKYGFDAQAIVRDNMSYLFQATYYYTGFHYVVGISLVILFLRLLVCTSNLDRLFYCGGLTVFGSALVMMANRTAMFSVAIAISAVLFLSFYVRKKRMLKVFLLMIAFILLGSSILLGGLLQYIGGSQSDLWIQRLFGGSPARIEIYVQAMTSWFSFPYQLLTGMGPDFLDGSGEVGLAHAFKFSGLTGTTEGTVDSGWLSYLIELGIISFAALVTVFAASISSVMKYLRQISDDVVEDTQAIAILGALFFITVALCTQMLGYTKLTWLPFQLLIIGLMHRPRVATKTHTSLPKRKVFIAV